VNDEERFFRFLTRMCDLGLDMFAGPQLLEETFGIDNAEAVDVWSNWQLAFDSTISTETQRSPQTNRHVN